MPSGILIIDKPAGWTSMDVCAKVRGIFHEKRVGHGGTLDPMATGVLPVFVGQATRGVEFAENGQKEYVAGLRLRIRKVENRSRQDGMCAKSQARRSVLPSFQKDRHPEIPDACPSAFESAASGHFTSGMAHSLTPAKYGLCLRRRKSSASF